LYVDCLPYSFGWSASLCRIRFCDTLVVTFLKSIIIIHMYLKLGNVCVCIYVCVCVCMYVYVHICVYDMYIYMCIIYMYIPRVWAPKTGKCKHVFEGHTGHEGKYVCACMLNNLSSRYTIMNIPTIIIIFMIMIYNHLIIYYFIPYIIFDYNIFNKIFNRYLQYVRLPITLRI
jgi:hypothetical protein